MSNVDSVRVREALVDQLRRYRELRAQVGEVPAREQLLAEAVPRQSTRMGQLLATGTLSEGFTKAVAALEAFGLAVEVVDVSTPDREAVLELLLTCTCLAAAQGLSVEPAEPLLCDLELEATRRAFPNLTVETLLRQTDGRRLCVFRYSRPVPANGGSS